MGNSDDQIRGENRDRAQNANVDNSLWYLAIAAFIVIVSAPPESTSGRVFDGAVLGLCACTGVFCIALAPLTLLYRRRMGRHAVETWVVVLMCGAAALQLLALAVLQHHLPAGYDAAPRISLPLHPSVPLLFQIIGRRVVLQPLGLERTTMSALAIALVGLLGVVAAVVAFRRGTVQMRLFLAFAAALLVMALAHPQGTDWSGLATPENSGRYFLIPEYASVLVVLWYVVRGRPAIRIGAVALTVALVAVVIPAQWSYQPFADTGFVGQANRFEHGRPGTTMVFRLNPLTAHWRMVLTKR